VYTLGVRWEAKRFFLKRREKKSRLPERRDKGNREGGWGREKIIRRARTWEGKKKMSFKGEIEKRELVSPNVSKVVWGAKNGGRGKVTANVMGLPESGAGRTRCVRLEGRTKQTRQSRWCVKKKK